MLPSAQDNSTIAPIISAAHLHLPPSNWEHWQTGKAFATFAKPVILWGSVTILDYSGKGYVIIVLADLREN